MARPRPVIVNAIRTTSIPNKFGYRFEVVGPDGQVVDITKHVVSFSFDSDQADNLEIEYTARFILSISSI